MTRIPRHVIIKKQSFQPEQMHHKFISHSEVEKSYKNGELCQI